MLRVVGFLVFSLLLSVGQAFAADKVEERYISQLVNGRPSTIRSAAESIYHSGVKDREVLDVAAEVLLQQYQENSGSSAHMDAFSWVCKAIGQSRDGRYRSALVAVANTANAKKLKKHCNKASKSLPKGEDDQYQIGGISLAAYKKAVEPATPQMDHLSEMGKETLASGEHPFSLVREGMSMEEVSDIVGQPTATTSQMTGKAFIPFYHGGDSGRMISLYKGLGRLVYNRTSAYSTTWRVLEIVEDTSEAGYP